MRILLLTILLFFVGNSMAYGSHYLLEDVSFITAEERASFEKVGVEATEQLLEKSKTAKARKSLAAKSGIALERIEALGKLTDLLQMRGIGPKMALLFSAAGCTTAKELSAQKINVFYETIKTTNKTQQISEVLPSPELVASWIKAAASVPVKFIR